MLKIAHPADVADLIDQEMAASSWVTVDQQMINLFAEATGDKQWIHIDIERAKEQLPGGKTIAHGYLIVSLMPRLATEISTFENVSRTLNYGSDRVRFTNMVTVGSRVRLRKTFKSVQKLENGGFRIVADCIMEIEGQQRPAVMATAISLVFP